LRGYIQFCAGVSFALLSIVFQALASAPDSLWSARFGGVGRDQCHSATQSPDGGYVLAGYTESFGAGNRDFWLVKAGSGGDSLWSRTFGGRDWDRCMTVQATSDGGYILAGETASLGVGSRDFWLVKTDSLGSELWNNTFGGSLDDGCFCVEQTSDGGYILAGYTWSYGSGSSDFWLVKTNSLGDSLWSRTFGGSAWDACNSVQQTVDGGYILGGNTYSYSAGSSDFWLVKTNGDGDSLWSCTFGGTARDECLSVVQTSDGGYALAGYTDSFGAGEGDFWLVKTDSLGSQLWTRTFGGPADERCYSIEQLADGGYILAGYTASFGAGNQDFWLLRTNGDGDSLWSRTFGGYDLDWCWVVEPTADGGYMLAGYTHSYTAGHNDYWLVRTGPDFSLLEPQGLVEWIDGDSVRLAWQPMPGASSYNVVWSASPFGDDWFLLVSTRDTTAADFIGISEKRFFHVKGVN